MITKEEFLAIAKEATPAAIEYLKENWNGIQVEVAWKEDAKAANRWMKLTDEEYEREKLRAVLEAKRIWEKQILPDLPERTLVFNAPFGGPDGVRDRIYQKGGFGRVDGDAYQYAIVKNGKLVPVELKDKHPGYKK